MLTLRPNCENCNCDLPANATEAMICSFECTFCRECVETVLLNVCPNCGGGFEPRPIRPVREWRDGISLLNAPASTEPVLEPVDPQTHLAFAGRIKDIDPEQR